MTIKKIKKALGWLIIVLFISGICCAVCIGAGSFLIGAVVIIASIFVTGLFALGVMLISGDL